MRRAFRALLNEKYRVHRTFPIGNKHKNREEIVDRWTEKLTMFPYTKM